MCCFVCWLLGRLVGFVVVVVVVVVVGFCSRKRVASAAVAGSGPISGRIVFARCLLEASVSVS